ncbi:methylthioribose-1-phosphate isomerase [Actinoplanes sp. SE50]|uniref:S-methyl-5-thioribose-1-phosphate isomerase n=1 Tax=unclassified Actinoplanes TaxID=2626549 RepID=UPI00023EE09B|nr:MULTISPECIES: S-methyl-5-thioribose-1-phosphate isomerase [unclassified Actinoplanes]AEV89022.1 methylthioribose-1-phosphate isomerase [Actinoplanes sp. SE50/110]ATO87428.1 methylthioribose-1-phosphate isomerase [Actinoplanes sp. SE50]SLM04846.1 S-methyl-5-thioribose-1-phosphate isomerase [Actinoplanes sp. SE50/110]
MRTIDWVDGAVEIIDQTALPGELRVLRLHTVGELIAAIQSLAVRGAPALGVAGALGVALAAQVHADDPGALANAVRRIETARPTAVNLARGAQRAAARLPFGPAAVLAEACVLRDEEIAASAAQASRGADLVAELCGDRPRLLTHCNTGGLAAVTVGTALGVIGELHRRGTLGGVIASETRPLLQGARLTAWELGQWGVEHRVAVDSAGPFLMARGEVDAVILGADRICANGDVINKIGTYAHALGARRAGLPFLVVAPETTVDTGTPSGADVEIEDRGAAEVTAWSDAVNPAFDVTPHDLVTAIVTDRRVIRLDRGEKP